MDDVSYPSMFVYHTLTYTLRYLTAYYDSGSMRAYLSSLSYLKKSGKSLDNERRTHFLKQV